MHACAYCHEPCDCEPGDDDRVDCLGCGACVHDRRGDNSEPIPEGSLDADADSSRWSEAASERDDAGPIDRGPSD